MRRTYYMPYTQLHRHGSLRGTTTSGVLSAARGAETHRLAVRVASLTLRSLESIAVVAFVARASSGVLSAARGAGAGSDSVLVACLAGNTADSILAVGASVALGASEPIAFVSRITVAGSGVIRRTGEAGAQRLSVRIARQALRTHDSIAVVAFIA